MAIVSEFFDTFFPYTCVLCGGHARKILCDECLSAVKPYSGKRCLKCSRPLPGEDNVFCTQCLKGVAFEKGFSLFLYEEIREIVYSLKYRNMPHVVHLLSSFSKEIRESKIFNGVSFLIPVPMHSKRIRKRGYNQAGLIARELSSIFHIPVIYDVLIKQKDTPPQAGLNYKQRLDNLKGAFSVKNTEKIEGKTVVLVDDVYTTGTTINQCALLLRRKGAYPRFFTLSIASPSIFP